MSTGKAPARPAKIRSALADPRTTIRYRISNNLILLRRKWHEQERENRNMKNVEPFFDCTVRYNVVHDAAIPISAEI
jgi:hypothetical protein